MVNRIENQISRFKQKDVQELNNYHENAIWKEFTFYKEIDKSRRNILALMHEIDNAYGNWNFMDRVLPKLFRELYEIFKNMMKIIKNGVKEIHYEIWIDNTWMHFPEYKKFQNEESKYYYRLEYLISKYKTDFVKIRKISENYSKNSYNSTWKRFKIRMLNIIYYYHQRAIKKCSKAAHSYFVKLVCDHIKNLELPLLIYPSALEYDLGVNFGKNKLKELFEPSYNMRTYDLGLEPIWTIEDEKMISAFYFTNVEDPFLLITNLDNSQISESIKESKNKVLFKNWFNTADIKLDIIDYHFNSIYFKYLRKKDLTPTDIEKSKNKIFSAYLKLIQYYGVGERLSSLIRIFRDNQINDIEKNAPFPSTEVDSYDPDNDIVGHSYYILNSIFPLIDFTWSKRNRENSEKDPEEIAIIDLETTGDNTYYDSIVEIGICKLNLTTGEINPLFNSICQEENKKINYDAWIFQNSDLKYDDVRDAPNLKSLRKEIQSILSKYPITSYNQQFDFSFLKGRGFKIPKKFWDPMFKAQYILKILRYNGDYKWPSFQESWNYFFPNKKYKVKHRALDDAINEAQVIYEIYKLQKEKEVKENV